MRQLSRHLLGLWTSAHKTSLSLLRRIFPIGLLNFLESDEVSLNKNCARWFVLAGARFPFTITMSSNQLNSLYNNIDKLCFKYGKHSNSIQFPQNLTCICNSSKSKLYLWLIHIVIITLRLPRTNWTYCLMLYITYYTLKYTRL